VDGALGANNPAEEVEEEAANIWCSDSRELIPLVKCFISVGTGRSGTEAIEDNALKFLSVTLTKMITETARTEQRLLARWAPLDRKRYFRFNVEQGLQDVVLSEYREQGKIQAVTDDYLHHARQVALMRDCAVNLRSKQSAYTNSFAWRYIASSVLNLPQTEPTQLSKVLRAYDFNLT